MALEDSRPSLPSAEAARESGPPERRPGPSIPEPSKPALTAVRSSGRRASRAERSASLAGLGGIGRGQPQARLAATREEFEHFGPRIGLPAARVTSGRALVAAAEARRAMLKIVERKERNERTDPANSRNVAVGQNAFQNGECDAQKAANLSSFSMLIMDSTSEVARRAVSDSRGRRNHW
jgi:hypothetical protein